jgi:multiple sugar transport system permease protein
VHLSYLKDPEALGSLSEWIPLQMSMYTTEQLEVIDAQSARARRHKRWNDFLHMVGNHSLLIGLSAIFILPLYLVVVISLMSKGQAETRALWPTPFVWHNYVEVFTAVPFLKWTLNTLFVSIMGTIGTVVSSVPPAYVLSRLQWKGRQVTFIIILSTMMLPGQVTMIPVYIIFSRLNWIPSFLPLIVPSFFASAFSIFLLRQFFTSIPDEISDAARIDGCSEFKLMMRIIVPLAKPAISAIALFAFLGSWNDFFGPLLYIVENENLWTLGIGLNAFQGEHHVDTNMMMTASALFMAPVIIIFFFSQKVFIEGVTLTGVKG